MFADRAKVLIVLIATCIVLWYDQQNGIGQIECPPVYTIYHFQILGENKNLVPGQTVLRREDGTIEVI